MRTVTLAAIFVCASLAAQSSEKAAAMGKQLAADFRQEHRMVELPAVEQYLERLGRRLAPDEAFTFGVTADAACPTGHQAVAFPGGYVFVPLAAFGAARDDAAFATLVARAMEISRRPLTTQGRVPLVWTSAGCTSGVLLPKAVQAQWQREQPRIEAAAAASVKRAGTDPEGFAAARQSAATYLPPPVKTPPTLRRK